MPDVYTRLDTWETLKAFVFDNAPRLAPRLEESRRQQEWRKTSPAEAQLLAMMVFLDFDSESAAARRKARQLLKDLLDSIAQANNGSHAVRETSPELGERLDDRQREVMTATLKWITSNPPAEWLESIAGPRSAVAMVEKNAKALKGLRAYRWLSAIGYPIVVPDNSRQRILVRLGWLTQIEVTQQGRAAALNRMEDIAREIGAPLGEMDLLLNVFSGGGDDSMRDAACCTTVPRCDNCPLQPQCPHFQLNRKEIRQQSRSLLATTRREQRPRERLEQRGAGVLSDEELIAIILRTGGNGINAVDLSQRLLHHAGNLDRLASMSVSEMSRFPGMGKVKAITVKAALEIAKRLRESSKSNWQWKMNSARLVFDFLRPRFTGAKKEDFYVLLLDTKLQLMREVLVSTGTLNQSLVHPREVFNEAIRDSAHAVIFAHNHPSGDPSPSRDDIAVTTKLIKAGEIVGIQVLDHVIIGSDRFYSFADEGKLS